MAMRWILPVVVLAFILIAPSMVSAQNEPFLNGPVRLVAAAGPGGNPDVLARLLAQKFTETLGHPFIVENMPGAGGMIAASFVAKAKLDGHVLMIGDSGALAISPALYPNLSYDPLRDFTPITALATVPTVLLVHPSVPAKTLAEFVALAKKEPGKMGYGSAGPGSIHHLTMAVFADLAGIDLLHVPYRGGSAMVNGLLTGEIQAGWSGIPNVIPLIDSGMLRAYCVSTPERSMSMPALPTCAALGYAGFDVATMLGLLAPAGVPQSFVDLVQSAAAKAMREPAMMERMIQFGMVAHEEGTARYQQFMKHDVERYAAIVRDLNLQIR
jgi:tripartite-type tricarboxylate transporter receptor subunit TctC